MGWLSDVKRGYEVGRGGEVDQSADARSNSKRDLLRQNYEMGLKLAEYKALIDELVREVESARSQPIELTELEDILRFPGIKKLLKKELHPDTHPREAASDRADREEMFKKMMAAYDRIEGR